MPWLMACRVFATRKPGQDHDQGVADAQGGQQADADPDLEHPGVVQEVDVQREVDEGGERRGREPRPESQDDHGDPEHGDRHPDEQRRGGSGGLGHTVSTRGRRGM